MRLSNQPPRYPLGSRITQLGAQMLREGELTVSELIRACAEAKRTGRPFEHVIAELGYLAETGSRVGY